jgi:hypothetical protein
LQVRTGGLARIPSPPRRHRADARCSRLVGGIEDGIGGIGQIMLAQRLADIDARAARKVLAMPPPMIR